MNQNTYYEKAMENFRILSQKLLDEKVSPLEFSLKVEEEINGNVEFLGNKIREKKTSDKVVETYTTWLTMEDIFPDVIDELSREYDTSLQEHLPEVYNTTIYIMFAQEHLRTLDPGHELLGMISIDDCVRMEKSYMDSYGSFENLPLYFRDLQKTIERLENF